MNIKDVYKYLDAKYPKDFPILKPKIDEFYQQGIKPDRIYNLVSQYIDFSKIVPTRQEKFCLQALQRNLLSVLFTQWC